MALSAFKTPPTAPPKTPHKAPHKTLPVVETFHSIQGEGFWSGCSAFFIRLAGCDVGCPWCDTKHSWPMNSHPHREIGELVEEAIAARPFMVVITGGEPLMHDLSGLTDQLRKDNLRVHLETSGAYPLSGQFDWIALSPKRFKPPLEEIYHLADELKVVIGNLDDLRWAESAAQKVSPNAIRLLQPQWGEQPAFDLVFDYVRAHAEWRVGLQTHKYLKVR
jgi:7-carboxy-7-deazaguanine synthase